MRTTAIVVGLVAEDHLAFFVERNDGRHDGVDRVTRHAGGSAADVFDAECPGGTQILVLDVTSILAQVHGDPVGARLLSEGGDLEWVRAAREHITGFDKVVWMNPVRASGESVEVSTRVYPDARFEVRAGTAQLTRAR